MHKAYTYTKVYSKLYRRPYVTSGIAPVRKYLDLDMKIGLGSDVAGGQTESIFRAITDAIGVSKMYLRYVDENAKAALELNLRQRIERSIYLYLDL